MKSYSAKAWLFPVILMLSIFLGGLTGVYFKELSLQLKPLGDIFLNLILTAIVPLIFFSVSSAIVKSGSIEKFGKTLLAMLSVFLFTGTLIAIYSLVVVKIFPPAKGVILQFANQNPASDLDVASRISGMFTVSDFSKLLSHENILALIVFSILVGLATITSKDKGSHFASFLQSGEEVFMKVFLLIMYYAPIGFFAYFAVVVSNLGQELLSNYLRLTLVYYVAGIIYFIFAYTFYAFLSGKWLAVKAYWKNVFLPMLTSIATCSSAASIPANLAACQAMKMPAEVYETTIPLGTVIHKEGSIMGGIFKIAFLFGVFHMDFTGTSVLLTALGVSLLVGTVMGAIPSGGMLGELLILAAYGFPSSVLIAIAAISILIDPLATMLNVTGNTSSSLLVTRLLKGRRWIIKN